MAALLEDGASALDFLKANLRLGARLARVACSFWLRFLSDWGTRELDFVFSRFGNQRILLPVFTSEYKRWSYAGM